MLALWESDLNGHVLMVKRPGFSPAGNRTRILAPRLPCKTLRSRDRGEGNRITEDESLSEISVLETPLLSPPAPGATVFRKTPFSDSRADLGCSRQRIPSAPGPQEGAGQTSTCMSGQRPLIPPESFNPFLFIV